MSTFDKIFDADDEPVALANHEGTGPGEVPLDELPEPDYENEEDAK